MKSPSFAPLSSLDTEPLNWGPNGLIPAVVIDEAQTVLMLAYMDKEAFDRTRLSGRTWFYSRSRHEYWAKGETSGNTQEVLEIYVDCDRDTLLIRVRQAGSGACHTGSYTCFTDKLAESPRNLATPGKKPPPSEGSDLSRR